MKRIIRNTTIADRLLFVILMAVAVGALFYSREAVSKSSDVVVEVKGKAEYTLPLDVDRTVPIDGPYGKTVIEIKDGKVRVKEAHCPNQLCVKQGWISQGAIICVPNKIVVLVGSGRKSQEKDLDAVSG